MRNFRPSPTHIPNIIKVGHTVPEICSGQKNMDGGRRTDIWITKSLPELSSGKTKTKKLLFFTMHTVYRGGGAHMYTRVHGSVACTQPSK